MVSRKSLMFVLLVAGIVCLGSAFRSRHTKEKTETAKTAAALAQILAQPADPNGTAEYVSQAPGSPLFEANQAFLNLQFAKPRAQIDQNALVKLGACLRSKNKNLRAECQNLSRFLLSDWVYNRQESEWHREPEIDVFFRIYKTSHSSELASFMKINRALNYERDYLNQI